MVSVVSRATSKRERLRQIEQWLRLRFPTPIPTRVRVERVRGALGDCGLIRDRLVVRVDSRLDGYQSAAVLIHEWAHAMAWGRERVDHDRAWSDRYGRVYRAFYDRDHDMVARDVVRAIRGRGGA